MVFTIATAIVEAVNRSVEGEIDHSDELFGDFKLKQWNYEEDITTRFDPNTFECEKCVVSRNCEVIDEHQMLCITWPEDSLRSCTTVQF